MPWYFDLLIIYFVGISLVSVVMTVSDKTSAKKGGWRIPEATLMTLGLFGGALSMYVTMKIIRHKTKHLKFMIGLPLEIAFHAVLMCLAIYFYVN